MAIIIDARNAVTHPFSGSFFSIEGALFLFLVLCFSP